MTLVYVDGFDHYAAADLLNKLDLASGASLVGASSTRWNIGQAVQISNDTSYIGKTGMPNDPVYVVGMNVNLLNVGTVNPVSFYDGINLHCLFHFLPDGTVAVYRAPSSSLVLVASSGIRTVPTNGWFYMEFKVAINPVGNSTGTAELRIDGGLVFSATGININGTGNQWVNAVTIGGRLANGGGGGTTRYDDLYILNGSGPVNANYLGDIRVATLFPNSNSADPGHNMFARGGSPPLSANWLSVSDNPEDGDTSYNAGAALADVDSYAFTDTPPVLQGIFGVQAVPMMRKDDVAPRSGQVFTRIVTTDYVATTNSVLTNNYRYYPAIYEVSPATSVAWNTSELNNAEFGVRVSL